MTTQTTGTVVPLDGRKREDYDIKLSSAFMKLEPELNDLQRMCDLALHACIEESERENAISDNGSITRMVLERLAVDAKKLRALWYALHEKAAS